MGEEERDEAFGETPPDSGNGDLRRELLSLLEGLLGRTTDVADKAEAILNDTENARYDLVIKALTGSAPPPETQRVN